MQVKYVGNRAFKERLAEIGYSEEEEQKAFQLFNMMAELGWNIDSSVAGWACCEIENKDEYIMFLNDIKKCKRNIHLR